MGNIHSVWFYLEPYVFISEDPEGYLFYNAKTRKGIPFVKDEAINHVVRYIQHPDNLYSIRIGVKELENEPLFRLVRSLQDAGCSDLIEGHLPKPVLMPPLLNLQWSVEHLKSYSYMSSMLSKNILSYLHEVTVHVTGTCMHHCRSCREMFKQYPCCTKSNDTLDFNLLKEFLHATSHTGASVNITGGDPFQYPELRELFDVLEKRNSLTTWIVNYRNLPEDPDILHLFTKELFQLKIIVNDSYREKSLVAIAERFQQNNIRQQWDIGVASAAEYEKAERLKEQLELLTIEATITPYYNRKNLPFFEENIFLQPEDLMSIALERQEIFALQRLNTHYFGKISILPDGKIYADTHKEPVGNLTEPIGDCLFRALTDGDSWRHTRYREKPCNQCRFRLICPSPSGYESAIGRPNLCHVKPAYR